MRASTLQKLIDLRLSSEQMAGVVALLAEELAPLDNIRESAAQRQAKRRNVMASRDNNVMGERDSNVTPRVDYNPLLSNLVEIPVNNTPPPPSKPKPAKRETPEGFETFWELYPARDGDRDRKGAEKAFRAALKRTSLETILTGVKGYRSYTVSKNMLNTQYVKQPRTWLNGDGWQQWVEQATTAAAKPAFAMHVVVEGSPGWDILKAQNPRLTARDIRTDRGIVRGTYAYPQTSKPTPVEGQTA